MLASLLTGYSKALYSNWLLYRPDHLLIDCGEGAATALGNGSYTIERVLLTHGHIDHISGLPSLLWSRAGGMGDKQKPLVIYHPRDDGFIEDMKNYLARTSARLPFALQWQPLDAGDEFSLSPAKADGRRVQTFATRHVPGRLTLGYKIVETRRRLKAEFSHLTEPEIRARAQSGGRDAVRELMENYQAILVAFGGDGLALDPADVRHSELLVHEATLLDAAERKHQLHATMDEALETAGKAQIKNLLLHHFSGRYSLAEIQQAARDGVTRYAIKFPVWCLWRDRLISLSPHSTSPARKP